jgi:hypothetical protein
MFEIRRAALILSAILHVGVFLLALYGVPRLFTTKVDTSPAAIEVEYVRLAEKTTPPPEPIEQKPAPPEPPKPEPPKAAEAKPEPPKPEPPKAEPTPEPAKPKPKELVEPAPNATPIPKPKPQPPQPAFDPNRLAALLDKRIKDREPPQPQIKSQPSPAPAAPPRLGESMTVSELDLIHQQIERYWSPPAGARDAGDLVVLIRIQLNPDGSLRAQPELVDRSRLGEDFWRAAAESALRAVRRSEPLRNLPPGKYEQWRDIDFTFNPKDMMGR